MIVCDELDEKTVHLGQALNVLAMVQTKELDGLMEIVTKHVSVAPDKRWSELASGPRVS